MFCPPRAVVLLPALAAVLVLGACRDVSQPALDDSEEPDVLVPVEREGAWGYVTGDGRLAIEPQYDRAYRFVDDRALVRQNGRYGFIDPNGTLIIPPTFSEAGAFSGGLAPVRPDSLWGFIDRAGTMIVAPRFRLASTVAAPLPSADSLARGPSDSTRPALVPPEGPTSYFSENRARIWQGGHWGYVDRAGRTVVPPRFARAGRFRDGLARVQFNDSTRGYIRTDGTVVWPPSRANGGGPPNTPPPD